MTRVRLEVTSIAPGGDGVAHVEHGGERRAVFVPRSVPGDVLEARVDWKTRPARATDVRVLTPSTKRRAPACELFEACGGCATMHLLPDARLEGIEELLRATVVRALGDGAPLPLVTPAPREEGYRTRARIAIHAGRSAVAGFHPRASRRVLPVARCLVLAPPLDRIFGLLSAAFDGARGDGEASVALGREGKPVASISWKGTVDAPTFAALDRAVSRGELAGVSLLLEDARSPAVIGDPTVWTTGSDGAPLEVAPGGFAQANPEVSARLSEHVAGLFDRTDRSVVELYAGSGNLTVAVAPGARSYLAVESDPGGVAAGRRNVAARGLTYVRFLEADAAVAKLPDGTSAIVLDPPRAGAAAVIPAIVASRALDVVYVSCDPPTLARDATALVRGGFVARSLHAFDMFPQTSHVETVLHLTRAARGRS